MDHQINTVIIPIDFIVSYYCHEQVKMIQESPVYDTFIHRVVPTNQITKK